MPGNQDQGSTVLLVTNQGLGKSVLELQQMLARTYFGLLNEHNLLPAAICFTPKGSGWSWKDRRCSRRWQPSKGKGCA
jgi:hypothetical protein